MVYNPYDQRNKYQSIGNNIDADFSDEEKKIETKDARPYLKQASDSIKEKKKKELEEANKKMKLAQQENKEKFKGATIKPSAGIDSKYKKSYDTQNKKIVELQKQLDSGKATSDQVQRINRHLDTLKGKQEEIKEYSKKQAMVPLNNYLETMNSPHISQQGKLKAKALYDKELQKLQKIYGSDISEQPKVTDRTLAVEPTIEKDTKVEDTLKTEEVKEETKEEVKEESKATTTEPTTETKVATDATSLTDDIFKKAWDSPERQAAAKSAGIENYTGTVEQNKLLQQKLSEGTVDTSEEETMLTPDITGKGQVNIAEVEGEDKTTSGKEKTQEFRDEAMDNYRKELEELEANKQKLNEGALAEQKRLLEQKYESTIRRTKESGEKLKDMESEYTEEQEAAKERIRKYLGQQQTEIGRSSAAAAAAAGRSGVTLPEGELQSLRAAFASKYTGDVAQARDAYEKNLQAIEDKIENKKVDTYDKQELLNKILNTADKEIQSIELDMFNKALEGDETVEDDLKVLVDKHYGVLSGDKTQRESQETRIEEQATIYGGKSNIDKASQIRDNLGKIEGIEKVDVEGLINKYPNLPYQAMRGLISRLAKEQVEQSMKVQAILQKAPSDRDASETELVKDFISGITQTEAPTVEDTGIQSEELETKDTQAEEAIEQRRKAAEEKAAKERLDIKKQELSSKQNKQKEAIQKIIREKDTNPRAYDLLAEKLRTNPKYKEQIKQLLNK